MKSEVFKNNQALQNAAKGIAYELFETASTLLDQDPSSLGEDEDVINVAQVLLTMVRNEMVAGAGARARRKSRIAKERHEGPEVFKKEDAPSVETLRIQPGDGHFTFKKDGGKETKSDLSYSERVVLAAVGSVISERAHRSREPVINSRHLSDNVDVKELNLPGNQNQGWWVDKLMKLKELGLLIYHPELQGYTSEYNPDDIVKFLAKPSSEKTINISSFQVWKKNLPQSVYPDYVVDFVMQLSNVLSNEPTPLDLARDSLLPFFALQGIEMQKKRLTKKLSELRERGILSTPPAGSPNEIEDLAHMFYQIRDTNMPPFPTLRFKPEEKPVRVTPKKNTPIVELNGGGEVAVNSRWGEIADLPQFINLSLKDKKRVLREILKEVPFQKVVVMRDGNQIYWGPLYPEGNITCNETLILYDALDIRPIDLLSAFRPGGDKGLIGRISQIESNPQLQSSINDNPSRLGKPPIMDQVNLIKATLADVFGLDAKTAVSFSIVDLVLETSQIEKSMQDEAIRQKRALRGSIKIERRRSSNLDILRILAPQLEEDITLMTGTLSGNLIDSYVTPVQAFKIYRGLSPYGSNIPWNNIINLGLGIDKQGNDYHPRINLAGISILAQYFQEKSRNFISTIAGSNSRDVLRMIALNEYHLLREKAEGMNSNDKNSIASLLPLVSLIIKQLSEAHLNCECEACVKFDTPTSTAANRKNGGK